jgi:hypothetical protein
MMDAPSEDAELQRRSTLRTVISGRIGNDLTAILFDGIRHPGQFQALEALIRSTAWSGPPKDPPKSTWNNHSIIDRLAIAHRKADLSNNRLAKGRPSQ